MPDIRTPRPYHLTIFGATGFTGRLVAEYLASAYGAEAPDGDEPLRWAVGGRDRAALEGLRADLGGTGEVGIAVADAHDPESLTVMCRDTEVVATTVGPYATYGSALVAACVASGTDYCDLSGEVPWMRRMIDRHHDDAYRRGVRVVHACGFDSVPSEVGVRHLQAVARERHGVFCGSVAMTVAAAKGSLSGGTYASLQGVLREASESEAVAELLADPYALNPPAPPGLCDEADQARARYSDDFDRWTAPFVMAGINTRIVRRGHALAGFPWGRGFCYAESMATGRGWRGRLTAKLMAGGIGAVMAGGTAAAVAARLAPSPGEGPSAAEREAGYFRFRLVGRTGGKPAEEVRTEVRGRRDPGYGCTSRMLAEAAVALARTRGGGREGGVLTPGYALGEELLEGGRLARAGVEFGVVG